MNKIAKIILLSLFLVSLHGEELVKDEIETMVENLVKLPEVQTVIGKKIDENTTITNISQDIYNKKTILYEYKNTNEEIANNTDSYSHIQEVLRNSHLIGLCNNSELQNYLNIGISFKYLYFDVKGRVIARLIFDKENCSPENINRLQEYLDNNPFKQKVKSYRF